MNSIINSMKKIILVLTMLGVTLNGAAQSSVEEQANRIGLPGNWKMSNIVLYENGNSEVMEQDVATYYIIKKDGTAQYTKKGKLANARWTLKGDNFHFWSVDKVNDPEGTDWLYQVLMVTPEKLVFKIEDDPDNYLIITFRKYNGSLQAIGVLPKNTRTTKRK